MTTPLARDSWLAYVSYLLYNCYVKLYLTYNGGKMHSYCIACKDRYIRVDGDLDTTDFICSYCLKCELTGMSGAWERLRFRILNRDEFICRYCGASPLTSNKVLLHIDHIMPRSKGGTNAESNLITACGQCNYGKLAFELKSEALTKVKQYVEGRRGKLYEQPNQSA